MLVFFIVFIEGRWKVWVATNGNASASTQAQVTITVYGHKGNSGPISLGSGDGSHFQSGNIDEFEEVTFYQVICVHIFNQVTKFRSHFIKFYIEWVRG